ncbi:MAG: NUDIX domain-containing protein [Nanoarchaeota archaeon]
MKYATFSYTASPEGILMIKKNKREDDPNSGYFAIPGGKLDINEKGLKNPGGRSESAIRETEDETGIKLINPVLRGIILFDNKDRTFDNWPNPDNFYVYLYSATEYSGELKESDEGIPLWVPEENILSLPKNPGDKLMYEWVKDGRNFIGVIKHKGNEIDEEGSWVDWF